MDEALRTAITVGLPLALLFIWGRHLWRIIGSAAPTETPPSDIPHPDGIPGAAGTRP